MNCDIALLYSKNKRIVLQIESNCDLGESLMSLVTIVVKF